MPEVGRRLEIRPLAGERGRDGVADVTAKRFAVRVVRRALFAAVQFGDGEIEAVKEGAQVGGGEVVGRAQDAGHAGSGSRGRLDGG